MNDKENNAMLVKVVNTILTQRDTIQTALLLVFVVLFALLALASPTYEWDLIPYIANASHLVSGMPVEALQSPIYENLKQTIPPDSYGNLVGSPTRLVLSQDPEAFRQTVAFFYDSRIVYTYINAAIIKTGINPITGIYAFSVLCSVLSALLLHKLIPVRAPLGICLVLPFIALSCGLFTVGRLAIFY